MHFTAKACPDNDTWIVKYFEDSHVATIPGYNGFGPVSQEVEAGTFCVMYEKSEVMTMLERLQQSTWVKILSVHKLANDELISYRIKLNNEFRLELVKEG